MPGFDWNGNGRSDAFDHFMDMKVMSDSSDTSDDSLSDYDDISDDTDDSYDDNDVDVGRAELVGTLRNVASNRSYTSSKSSTSFQDELRQNLRSPEIVRQENADRLNNSMRFEAERTIKDIKNSLMYKAKNAEYVTENGCTSLTCFCQMPYRFMRTRREDNGDQLRQNQKNFFLFRDPKLVYMTWNNYEIEPKYSTEYRQYMSALKELAAKENIIVESVVYSSRENKYVTFPSRVRNDYSFGWSLCVKATTIISGNKETVSPKTASFASSSTNTKNTTQANSQQREQESNGTTIVKSFLCIGLCVLGFVIAANAGGLIGAIALIGAAILGYKIMSS